MNVEQIYYIWNINVDYNLYFFIKKKQIIQSIQDKSRIKK